MPSGEPRSCWSIVGCWRLTSVYKYLLRLPWSLVRPQSTRSKYRINILGDINLDGIPLEAKLLEAPYAVQWTTAQDIGDFNGDGIDDFITIDGTTTNEDRIRLRYGHQVKQSVQSEGPIHDTLDLTPGQRVSYVIQGRVPAGTSKS